MARLLEIGGANAAMAALLAIMVWAITRHGWQPAFAHLLWVLVMVKLITPPLLPIPWRVASDVSTVDKLVTAADEISPQIDLNQSIAAKNASAKIVEAASRNVAATSPPRVSPFADVPWTTCLGGLWLTGSAIWLAVAVGRLARFHFALSAASLPSDELQRLADDVAAKLGVRRYRVRVTSGRLSPMVWPIGRPTVVVPQNLLDILTEPELRAILTHEFAHLRPQGSLGALARARRDRGLLVASGCVDRASKDSAIGGAGLRRLGRAARIPLLQKNMPQLYSKPCNPPPKFSSRCPCWQVE